MRALSLAVASSLVLTLVGGCKPPKTQPSESDIIRQQATNNARTRADLLLDLLEAAATPIRTLQAQTVTRWVPWDSHYNYPPTYAVEIGEDRGDRIGRRDTYVCRGEIKPGLWLPGKWVVGRCNIGWQRHEYVLTSYEVAISETGCWGWPKTDYVWLDGSKAGTHYPVCRSYFREDRGFYIFGSPQTDRGWQGGHLVPNSCQFGWDGGTRDVVLPEVYYPTCPDFVRHPTGGPSTPIPPGDPKIRVSISPSTITVGQQAVLVISLDRPAPPNFVVVVTYITNTGSDSEIDSIPVSAAFAPGTTSWQATLATHRVPAVTVPTSMVWIASRGAQQAAVNFTINP